jgi:hypothetical protein
MTKQELVKQLTEKKEMASRTQIAYHQLVGQILLLEEQLKELEKEVK